MIEYKTIFIQTEKEFDKYPNGFKASRDIQTAINENVREGYKLHSIEAMISTKNDSGYGLRLFDTFTSGFILIFEKQ